MKRFIIVANWKMYPPTLREARKFFAVLEKKIKPAKNVELVVAPPFPYLILAKPKKYALGAQDVFWEKEGSFTGEVSGRMIKNIGARYVIIGHSERRTYLGETGEMIQKKVKKALETGLNPILCVGEARRDGEGKFFGFIRRQVEEVYRNLKKKEAGRVIIAYEPIWAIGSGKPAKPRDVSEAALFIKKTIADIFGAHIGQKVRILYGGSVDASNARGYLTEPQIAGLLIGRESRLPQKFLKIVECARSLS